MKRKSTTNVLTFERNADGSVTVYVAMHDGTMQKQETINDGIWGSIIANMSSYGEDRYGWYRAMQFHKGSLTDRLTEATIQLNEAMDAIKAARDDDIARRVLGEVEE